MSLGVAFLGILLFAAYFAYTNGIDPRTLFSAPNMPSMPRAVESDTSAGAATGATGAQTNLSASQEAALRAVGIDPAVLTSFTGLAVKVY